MDSGEQITGTRDEHYNLVSVLYHALHGAETIETYILDAEAADDDELAAFLREVQETQREVAERVKGRLGIGGVASPETVEDPLLETLVDADPVDIRGRVAPEVGLPLEGDVGPETPLETDVMPPDASPRETPGGMQDETLEPPPPSGEEPPPPGPPQDTNAPA